MIPRRPLYFPQANLNGSSVEDMAKWWREVTEAADALREKLRNVVPHGRDYQTCQMGAYQASREQHEVIERAVEDIIEFSTEHALYWHNQHNEAQEKRTARPR